MDTTSNPREMNKSRLSTGSGSKLIIQNGSFFYPKKAGFRETAKYTEVLGDRDQKRYTQRPGGEPTINLGSETVSHVSTVREALAAAVNPDTKAAVDKLAHAGHSNKQRRDRTEGSTTTRVLCPPGGPDHVVLVAPVGAPGRAPYSPRGEGAAPKLSTPAREKAAAGVPAGVKYLDLAGGDEEVSAPSGRRPLQGIGGNTTVVLGDPQLPLPKLSLMGEDMLLAYHPALQQSVREMPVHGAHPDASEWKSMARVDGPWTEDHVKDFFAAPTGDAPNTVWELDVQRARQAALAERASNENSEPGEKYSGFAGKTAAVTDRSGLRHFPQAYTSSVGLTYATTRDDLSAALSPPRAKNIPLHCDPRTMSARRRAPSVPIKAKGSVGSSIVGGIASDNAYVSSYQVACSGERAHEARARRPLVRHLCSSGGPVSLSLHFDPDAAGVRTVFDVGSGENPITAGAPPFNPFAPPQPPAFGRQPVPSTFGKRVAYLRPESVLMGPAEGSPRATSLVGDGPLIRRVAPPGGWPTVALA